MATETNDATAPTKELDVEMDVDADMEDTQDATTASATTATKADNTQNNESSSTTLDHEFTQSEPQPSAPAAAPDATTATGTTTGTGLLHGNRKDVTLREFLSKMDDYAPIVCISVPTLPFLNVLMYVGKSELFANQNP